MGLGKFKGTSLDMLSIHKLALNTKVHKMSSKRNLIFLSHLQWLLVQTYSKSFCLPTIWIKTSVKLMTLLVILRLKNKILITSYHTHRHVPHYNNQNPNFLKLITSCSPTSMGEWIRGCLFSSIIHSSPPWTSCGFWHIQGHWEAVIAAINSLKYNFLEGQPTATNSPSFFYLTPFKSFTRVTY